MTLGARRDFDGLVDEFDRRYADRTTGPVDQRYVLWKHLVQAELHDCVRLASADFHDLPRLRDELPDPVCVMARGFGVAIFVHEFHGRFRYRFPAWMSETASIAARYLNTSRASCSSTMLMAKPA